jgi:hypothetical protein
MQQRNLARELGLVVTSVAVLVHWLDPRPAALATAFVVVAAAVGTGPLLGESRPWRMPLVPMVLPALAAFSIAGVARVVDPMPWLAIDFLAGWAILTWVVSLETSPEVVASRQAAAAEPAGLVARAVSTEPPTYRLRPKKRAEFDLPLIVSEPVVVNTPELPPHPRPLAVRWAAFGLAFPAFVAAGALVPGGLVIDRAQITAVHLAELVVLSGAIAGLIGYRMASLTSPHRFDRIVRIVAIGQYALPLAAATFVLREMSLPRLFIPALLALTVYAATELRESPDPVPQNPRLLQELAVLGVAAAAAVAWGWLAR